MKKEKTIINFSILIVVIIIASVSCKKNDSTDNTNQVLTGTVQDIEGNIYKTIKIGNQWWMAENLKVKHYRNHDTIPYKINTIFFDSIIPGMYCNYNNDTSYVNTYGRLYNWYAVNDYRNISPVGWHIPTLYEWITLVQFLGGESVAGGKMKEIGNNHWIIPNAGATNESGFTAVPGGMVLYDNFGGLGEDGDWWSSTSTGIGTTNAWAWRTNLNVAQVFRFANLESCYYSIRCIKDN